MRMKLLNLIVLFTFAADLAGSQSISCTYTDNPYTCNLQIQNSQGVEFDSVPGNHLEGNGFSSFHDFNKKIAIALANTLIKFF